MKHLCWMLLVALAFAVAAAESESAPEPETTNPPPASCAESTSGFVDGKGCYSFGGRLYAANPGEGVESAAIIGPKVVYLGAATVDGNAVEGFPPDAADGTFVFFRVPDSPPRSRLTVLIDDGGNTRAKIGGRVATWGNLSPGGWHIAVRGDGEWHVWVQR